MENLESPKNNTIENNRLKSTALSLTGIAALLLLILVILSQFIIPDFQSVFASLDAKLPISTQLLMFTYPAWWLLPLCLFVSFILLLTRKKQLKLSHIFILRNIGISGIFLAVLLLIFATYAIYAPVLSATNCSN